MGLLDINMNTPEGEGFNSALMAAAQALLTPRAQGGGMGAAFGAFPKAIEHAQLQSQRARMLGLQEKQMGQQGQRMDFDMAQAQRQQAERDAKKAQLAQFAQTLPENERQAFMLNPDDYFKTHEVAPGASLVRGGKTLFTAPPKADAPPEVVKLMQQMEALPEGHPWRAMLQQAITKATTHPPRVSVNVGGQKDADWGTPPPNHVWARDDSGRVLTERDTETGANRPRALPVAGGPAEKLPEGQQKQLLGVTNLKNAITEYRSQLSKWSAADAINPNKRAEMGTKYMNMMLQAKEAYGLGVLNGPDFHVLTGVITDPRSMTGVITSSGSLDKQASELDRIMSGIGAVTATQRPSAPGKTTSKRLKFNQSTGALE